MTVSDKRPRQYKPGARSARGRLLAFFQANPDEELTYPLIEAKFSVSPTQARHAVARMRNCGELETLFIIRRPERGRA